MPTPPAPRMPPVATAPAAAGTRPVVVVPRPVPVRPAVPVPESVEELQPLEQRRWRYKDAFGDVQGPFSSSQMSTWSRAGCFPPETLVRADDEPEFAPLGNGMRLLTASF